jgi:hypothetical protein
MKTIETYLPVFPGFYGTIFEPNEDSELEYFNNLREENHLTPVSFDQFKFDYSGYENEIAKNCCNFIENELKDYISKVEFERLKSPKEYNFYNDAIDCKISLSDENIKAIKDFIGLHVHEFNVYIHDNYTSYDGFLSHYSNDFNEWVNDIDNCLTHIHKLGSILNFICWCLDINQESMYEYCYDVHLEVTNYYELEYSEFCPVCQSFIPYDKFKGNCCEDCYNSKVENLELFLCSKCKTEITSVHEKRHLEYQIKHGLMLYSKILCDKCQ